MLTKLTASMNTHQNLPDEPNSNDGYTPEVLKQKFDEAPNLIKTYINDTLLTELPNEFATNEALSQVIAGQVNLVDTVTATKYAWRIENGLLALQEVE